MTLCGHQTRSSGRWRTALRIQSRCGSPTVLALCRLKMFDTRRHLRHGRRARRNLHVETNELTPPTVAAVQAELNVTQRERQREEQQPNPAGYDFPDRETFLRWRASMLRQLDPSPMR